MLTPCSKLIKENKHNMIQDQPLFKFPVFWWFLTHDHNCKLVMPIFRVPEKLVKCGLAKACILNNKFFKAVYIEDIFSPSNKHSSALNAPA